MGRVHSDYQAMSSSNERLGGCTEITATPQVHKAQVHSGFTRLLVYVVDVNGLTTDGVTCRGNSVRQCGSVLQLSQLAAAGMGSDGNMLSTNPLANPPPQAVSSDDDPLVSPAPETRPESH
ncbi:unnamed protein product [Merluccius merluccius]